MSSPYPDNDDAAPQRSTRRMLEDSLAAREGASALRELQAPDQRLVDFLSNDYLGIARLPDPYVAGSAAGSTGSRLLSGSSPAHAEAEELIASFHGAESALLFNSGYDANLGLISALARRGTTVVLDELCHASIHDGARLGLGRALKFRHNDACDLDRKLSEAKKARGASGPLFVIVESIYSMDGDLAPLDDLSRVALSHGADLVVDEAHATGVFGPRGEGLVAAGGLESSVFARVHTFGKALGRHGAAVVGPEVLKRYLVNFCRPFIYSTALPPSAVRSVIGAYEEISRAGAERERLFELIGHYGRACAGIGPAMPGPIQVIPVGDARAARRLADGLREGGLNARAILSPTVPAGSERLRVCLHAFNTESEIDLLVSIASGRIAGEPCAVSS